MEYEFLGLMMLLIALWGFEEMKPADTPVIRVVIAGISFYAFTVVTSPILMIVFFGFALYNLFRTIQK